MESRKKQNKMLNRRSEHFFLDPPRKKGFPSSAVFLSERKVTEMATKKETKNYNVKYRILDEPGIKELYHGVSALSVISATDRAEKMLISDGLEFSSFEIVEVEEITDKAKQVVEYDRWELHVKKVLTPQDLRDIVYAAMPYTMNITPTFFQALAQEVIENQGKNLTRTKAEIKADYF